MVIDPVLRVCELGALGACHPAAFKKVNARRAQASVRLRFLESQRKRGTRALRAAAFSGRFRLPITGDGGVVPMQRGKRAQHRLGLPG